jgi:phosphohistidine phosphatase SixA
MKQIFLLRHAKSDWSTMGQQDFDRGLASRGIKDISLISDSVKKNNFKMKFFVVVQIELKKHLIYVQMDLILISKMSNTSMIFIMVIMNQ